MTDATLACPVHPERETTLRCNRCDRPMCSQCAVQTPVGYRCTECVRGQQRIFDTAFRRDYALASVVAAVGTAIGVGLLTLLGIFGVLLAPLLGAGLAELIRRGVGRRRSRRLPMVASVAGAIGSIPHVVGPALEAAFRVGAGGGGPLLGSLLAVLWPLLVAGIAVSSLYYRLGGIRIG